MAWVIVVRNSIKMRKVGNVAAFLRKVNVDPSIPWPTGGHLNPNPNVDFGTYGRTLTSVTCWSRFESLGKASELSPTFNQFTFETESRGR